LVTVNNALNNGGVSGGIDIDIELRQRAGWWL
jgi:hypothetical protein